MSSTKNPHCPLCDTEKVLLHAKSTDVEYATTPEVFSFYNCQTCDILFVFPMLGDQLDQIYPTNYYAFDNAKASLAQKVKRCLDLGLFKKITHRFPKGQPLDVLDVGGGDGCLLDIFKGIDHEIGATWVVDLDKSVRNKALEKGHNFHLGPIEMFTHDDKFDVILMLNIIEHVTDPGKVLKQIKSLLGKNGVVLIKTPNFKSLDARLFRNHDWGDFHTPRHFVLFTPGSFAKLAKEAGLKVSSCQLTQGAPFWAVSLLALAHRYGVIKIDYGKGLHRHWLYKPVILMSAAFDILRGPFFKTSQMFVALEHKD